jgi:hypothetical protein
MNNDMSPMVLLKPKEKRKPTKKEIMKKVFIVAKQQIKKSKSYIKP